VRVLTFVDYYLPGYRYGGPPKTIANLVEALGDEFEFLVVTRDREFGACEPYAEVQINDWNTVGKAKVFYAGPSMLSFRGIRRLLNDTAHDVLYLNSFVSPKVTGLPFLIRYLGFSPRKPLIIAPRGELSSGALAIKPTKKRLYITAVNFFRLQHGVIWQASSIREAEDIIRVLGQDGTVIRLTPTVVKVVPDIWSQPELAFAQANETPENRCERVSLRMVFLSRISPMKNLDFLLRLLGRVKAALQLTLYGTVTDLEY
jgi:glycosyltransferase involved in cell wall biosynthesis